MSKPVAKVARRKFDARYADSINLALSSEWKTPKIFKQIGTPKTEFKFQDVITPAGANGVYYPNGEQNGKRAYTNGTYWIWWNGTDRWNLTNTKGSGTVVFYRLVMYSDENEFSNYIAGTGVGSRSGWQGGTYYTDMAIFYRSNPGVTWTSPLDYYPSYMSFRGLSPSSGTSRRSFKEGQFTHLLPSLSSSPGEEGLSRLYDGTWRLQIQEGDESAHVLLTLDPLEGEPPNTYLPTSGPVFLLGDRKTEVTKVFPYYNAIDSRFNTFKIFKTGTLTLELPEETVYDHSTHMVTVKHNLGYPPVFLPEVGVGWVFPSFWGPNFIVNDELGEMEYYSSEMDAFDVYVDSEKLYMRYTRIGWESGLSFNARTIVMYYTLFHNDISEEFDLLTS